MNNMKNILIFVKFENDKSILEFLPFLAKIGGKKVFLP